MTECDSRRQLMCFILARYLLLYIYNILTSFTKVLADNRMFYADVFYINIVTIQIRVHSYCIKLMCMHILSSSTYILYILLHLMLIIKLLMCANSCLIATNLCNMRVSCASVIQCVHVCVCVRACVLGWL